MKKKSFLFVLVSNLIFSQVGVNTTTPNATLEVVGKPEIPTIPDGIIPPRLTLVQLNAKNNAYNQNQKGFIVYVTEINTLTDPINDKVKFVTIPGYYVFNGQYWATLETQTGEVFFKANSGDVDGLQSFQADLNNGYTHGKIQLNNIITNTGGGIWNADNTYTIPITGTYMVSARIRTLNNTNPKAIMINVVAGDDIDTASSVWNVIAYNHYTISFYRNLYFQKGDKINLHYYLINGNPTYFANASFNLLLLSSNGN